MFEDDIDGEIITPTDIPSTSTNEKNIATDNSGGKKKTSSVMKLKDNQDKKGFSTPKHFSKFNDSNPKKRQKTNAERQTGILEQCKSVLKNCFEQKENQDTDVNHHFAMFLYGLMCKLTPENVQLVKKEINLIMIKY